MSVEPVEVDAGGVMLRGEAWSAGAAWVLLVHEPGEEHDLDDWRAFTPFLLGAGVSVLAIDLRGHGASDGDPDPVLDDGDIAAAAEALRQRGATTVIVIGAGASGLAVVRACEAGGIHGAVALTPPDPGAVPPRGAGVAKLIVASARREGSLDAATRLRSASIGPALLLSLPAGDAGAALLSGEMAATCREHILAFVRERAVEQETGGSTAPDGDLFLKRLGIAPKGANE